MTNQEPVDVSHGHPRNDKKDFNQKRFKKARLKMTAALLSAFLIIVIPVFRGRYIDFNSLYSTTLSDFTLFGGLVPEGSTFLLFEIPVFLVFIALVFLYVIVMFSQMRTLGKNSDEEAMADFKRLYNRFDVLVFIVHLMALYMIMNAFFFSMASIEGRSMEPTLHDGDNVVMVHVDETYDRSDLVVVRPQGDSEEFFIKRLIALPGETLRIDEEGVWVDGTLMDEPYLENGIETRCPQSDGGEFSCEWALDEDEYFVMGDNRLNSLDSRHLGSFEKSRLYGRVEYRMFPLGSAGKVE